MNRQGRRAIIAALVSSGLIVPAQAKLYMPPAPAIIKPAKDWAAHEKMLLGSFLPGMMPSWDRTIAGAGPSVSASLTDTSGVTTATSSFSFASQAIGAASTERIIEVFASTATNLGATISTITINGISATLSGQQGPSGTSSSSRAGWAVVPTGTSVTIAVTTSTSTSGMSIMVYAIYNANPTPSFNQGTQNASGSTSIASVTFAAGGLALAGAGSYSGTGTMAWTNASEDHDSTLSFGRQSSATMAAPATVTVTQASTSRTLIVTGWDPL